MRHLESAIFFASVVALLSISSVGWAESTGENESNSYMLNTQERDELIAFVNEARDYVVKQGKDKALNVFNNPEGDFVDEDIYIIAYDFNGTCLAHPYDPELIGKNVINTTDANGVALKKNMREVAKSGSGFTYYVWPNPAHPGSEELKLTYVLKVDEELWLGAGVYLPMKQPIFANRSREDLIAFVNDARDFALNTTKEAALKVFNDKNGRFVQANRYIFAFDFNGTNLAQPIQPELRGENRIDTRDSNGVLYDRDMTALAQNGRGLIYYLKSDPARNMTQGLKLSYVTKVDDTWWLGSGIYAEG